MRYVSVCSGIEAATLAWHPLGWTPAAFAEIDRFPSSVLKHRYPHVPNVGDFTTIRGDEFGTIDLLVGGTPCQDFSVAGLRKGMAGKRGQLTIEFADLAYRLATGARTRWLAWENVPGVLSIDDGEAFALFLSRLTGKPVLVPDGGWQNSGIIVQGSDAHFGLAYRVLDAQFFGVPQRRRRVFVIGYLGDWRRAAAVLFERHSLSGHPPPRRKKGKGTAAGSAPCLNGSGRGVRNTGESRGQDPVVAVQAFGGNNTRDELEVATAVRAHGSVNQDFESETFLTQVCPTLRAGGNQTGGDRPPGTDVDTADSLIPIAFSAKDSEVGFGEVAPPLRSMNNIDSHANGGGQVAVAFKPSHFTRGKDGAPDEFYPPLSADADKGDQDPVVAVAFESRFVRNGRGAPSDIVPPLKAQSGETGKGDAAPLVAGKMAVRRLTPRETERLQGMPDDWTKISDKTADGPRYRATGNSMAVPCMAWIGQRIQMVEDLCGQGK